MYLSLGLCIPYNSKKQFINGQRLLVKNRKNKHIYPFLFCPVNETGGQNSWGINKHYFMQKSRGIMRNKALKTLLYPRCIKLCINDKF
jgi:hypothetical protein